MPQHSPRQWVSTSGCRTPVVTSSRPTAETPLWVAGSVRRCQGFDCTHGALRGRWSRVDCRRGHMLSESYDVSVQLSQQLRLALSEPMQSHKPTGQRVRGGTRGRAHVSDGKIDALACRNVRGVVEVLGATNPSSAASHSDTAAPYAIGRGRGNCARPQRVAHPRGHALLTRLDCHIAARSSSAAAWASSNL